MPYFRYIGENAQGQRDSGELLAADEHDARRQLQAQGFLQLEVVEPASAVADQAATGRNDPLPAVTLGSAAVAPLSSGEAEEVLVTLAELSNAEVPLVEGLRAAAAECANRRVATALQVIAADCQQGYSLERSVSDRAAALPPHVRGLIAAAARTHRLGVTLDDLVEHYRLLRETRAQVIASLSYPLLVLSLALGMVSFLPIAILPTFKRMFEEFGLQLPLMTVFVIRLSDALRWFVTPPGIFIVLGGGALFAALLLAATLGRTPPIVQRFAASMPLLGPLWQWSGAAAFARLMATMLDNNIPLTEALQLAADGVPDPETQTTARLLSRQVSDGRSLGDAIWEQKRLPVSMVPLLRWGERTNALPEAFRTCSELLLSRVRLRALLLRSVSPPLIFLVVGLIIGIFVLALFMPMVSLIQGLA